MNSQFNSLAANRRSIYALGDNLSQTPEEIFDLVKQTIKNSPTAFNSQTVRAVVLFGKSSDKVWEIVEDALRKSLRVQMLLNKQSQKLIVSRQVMERSSTLLTLQLCIN